MTFSEAKDQYAQSKGYPHWNAYWITIYDSPIDLTREYEEVGYILEQHAASVREEAWKDGYDSGMSFQYNHGDSYTADEAWAICNPTAASPAPQ